MLGRRKIGHEGNLVADPLPGLEKGLATYLGMVEAVGVEPTSENASERTSTRVGTLFRVSHLPAAAGLQAQQAD